MKYRFIEEHRGRWPVRLMCQVLQVSPGGFYTWRERPTSARQQRREVLKREIEAIHQEFKERYGSPRIHEELQARGQRCCVNTAAKLMRQHGIAAKSKRKFRCTTDSSHDLPVAHNILGRQFQPLAVNQVWVADITYIPTEEGWLYLAAVEDLYSRQIVGWSMSERMTSRLVVDNWEADLTATSSMMGMTWRPAPLRGYSTTEPDQDYCSDIGSSLLACQARPGITYIRISYTQTSS